MSSSSTAEQLTVRAWHRLRRPLTRRRWAFMTLSRLRSSRDDLLVTGETALMIEAPMRSGNTFAVAAFHLWNGDGLHVARHTHTAAHVLEAVRLGVPVLVLVRDPRAVALSHVLRRPALTVGDSLVDYALFFETLQPVRSQLVAATFDEVTASFDQVLERVNDRFGTHFAVGSAEGTFSDDVFAMVEEMNRAERRSKGAVDELRVARPSPDREIAKKALVAELEDPANAARVERAMASFRSWSSHG